MITIDKKLALQQLAEMDSRVTLTGIKSIVWYFNKTMRHAI